MREIKFRAWDKIHNEWAYNWIVSYKGIHSDGGWDDICASNETTDRYILMQYTGLKDKNGIEIYEGDIVRLVGGNIGDFERNKSYEVWFAPKAASFKLKGSYKHGGGERTLGSKVFEIVSNIYKTPELMEESD